MNKKISNSSARLKELMETFGISQSELCEKTKLNKSVISLYVNGKRDPRQDNLALISETFNINPAWLMGFDVPMENKTTYNKKSADLLMDSYEDKSTRQVMEIMKQLDEKGKDQVLQYATFVLTQNR